MAAPAQGRARLGAEVAAREERRRQHAPGYDGTTPPGAGSCQPYQNEKQACAPAEPPKYRPAPGAAAATGHPGSTGQPGSGVSEKSESASIFTSTPPSIDRDEIVVEIVRLERDAIVGRDVEDVADPRRPQRLGGGSVAK